MVAIRILIFRVGHISLNINVEISGFKFKGMDWIQRNLVFETNSEFLVHIYLRSAGVNL